MPLAGRRRHVPGSPATAAGFRSRTGAGFRSRTEGGRAGCAGGAGSGGRDTLGCAAGATRRGNGRTQGTGGSVDRTPGWGHKDAGGAGSLDSYGAGGAWAEQAQPGTGSSGGGSYSGIAAEADAMGGRLPQGYRLLRRIGTGRHSTVLLCREEETGQEVAVKLLHLTVDDEGARLAAHSELLSAGAAAKHSCSVLVDDAGFTQDNHPYLVERFCRGGNAQAKLANSGTFPVDEVVVIGIRAALSLACAHRRGVLHLDVRPANVLFDDAGDALLADHGVGRVLQRSAPELGAVFDPMYASRELFGWEKPGPSADVYSLGATLYALLNGLPAYAEAGSTSWSALYNEVLRGELPHPHRMDVPPQLFDLVRRMMSVNPEGRPPLTEVHRVLRLLLPPAYASRVPDQDPEPAPEAMLPGWDPADDVTPEEQAEAERIGAEAEAELKRRSRRRIMASAAALVVFAGAATAMTLVLHHGGKKTQAHGGPSGSASAPAAGTQGNPQAQQVPQDKVAALMPRGVSVAAADGSVQVSWKQPQQPATVAGYYVQASADGKQVALKPAGSKTDSEVVFTDPASLKQGVCYTVVSIVELTNGQVQYAPAAQVCRTTTG
ncbi:protein kinase [Streptomyces sp. PTM05]|uniref:Protein kinase n=1 Tax=Streptantibioticus parmotrematis TaxID=2873249 RepID=A0ABS7QZD6_9ACTN|nr:protein kinase [Streptantibioticus parmotrematis]